MVIQQAPDASRIQELAQRSPELQQFAAASDLQREVRRDQTQVRQPHPTDAYNRIDPRQPRERAPRQGKGKGKTRSTTAEQTSRKAHPPVARGGGVVDVVV